MFLPYWKELVIPVVASRHLIGMFSGNTGNAQFLQHGKLFSQYLPFVNSYCRSYEYPFRVLKDNLMNLQEHQKVIKNITISLENMMVFIDA